MQTLAYVLGFLLSLSTGLFAQGIEDYRQHNAVCHTREDGKNYIALRSFVLRGTMQYLLVDPSNLSTRIGQDSKLDCANSSWQQIQSEFGNSPYFRGLREADSQSDPLQDAGITHFLSIERGVDLTIDLCLSKLPLDRVVFIDLINELGKEEKPIPLAIAITGVWMEEHPADLKWLLDLQAKGEISVDWINHTYHHRTSRNLPLRENFILEKGTDVNAEILQTEVKMLEMGMIPTVFFRFPGLVSDTKVFHEITSYGLIPVGSDAWLAKNQWPEQGSIVLIMQMEMSL